MNPSKMIKKRKILSEVIDELQSRIVPLIDVATKGDLEITELSLQKEQVRASIIKWVTGLLILQT